MEVLEKIYWKGTVLTNIVLYLLLLILLSYSPYIPELTTSGFHGCVEVVVEDDSVIPVFRGKHFSDYYLNSKIQKSLSGTCLTSVCCIFS